MRFDLIILLLYWCLFASNENKKQLLLEVTIALWSQGKATWNCVTKSKPIKVNRVIWANLSLFLLLRNNKVNFVHSMLVKCSPKIQQQQQQQRATKTRVYLLYYVTFVQCWMFAIRSCLYSLLVARNASNKRNLPEPIRLFSVIGDIIIIVIIIGQLPLLALVQLQWKLRVILRKWVEQSH